jgi:hypothetical protein
MKLWEEMTVDDYEGSANYPDGGRHRVESYGARTIRGGDSVTFHGSLLTARVIAFFAVLRGDAQVVVVSVRVAQ